MVSLVVTTEKAMLTQKAPYPYFVGFDQKEIVVTFSALVHLLRYYEGINEAGSVPNSANPDPQIIENIDCCTDIAESLIIRLQDALDEDQIQQMSKESTYRQTELLTNSAAVAPEPLQQVERLP